MLLCLTYRRSQTQMDTNGGDPAVTTLIFSTIPEISDHHTLLRLIPPPTSCYVMDSNLLLSQLVRLC